MKETNNPVVASKDASKVVVIGEQYAGLIPEKISYVNEVGTRFFDCRCFRCGSIVENVCESDILNFKVRCCSKCNRLDLTGMKFNRLTVIRLSDVRTFSGEKRWECRCDCGNLKTVQSYHLTHGESRSCGCLVKEINSKIHSIDLVGKRFGRLTVIEKVRDPNRDPGTDNKWKCKCDCGNYACVLTSNLTTGNTNSCGCYRADRTSEAHLKWKTPEEQRLRTIYDTMIQRCHNPNNTMFDTYGARGIYVCDEWRNKENGRETFVKWALSHGYANDLEIDRKNEGKYHELQNGPYAPWNCRWVDEITQANNKRNNLRIVINGEEHTLAEWVRMSGVDYHSTKYMYKHDPERAKQRILNGIKMKKGCVNESKV